MADRGEPAAPDGAAPPVAPLLLPALYWAWVWALRPEPFAVVNVAAVALTTALAACWPGGRRPRCSRWSDTAFLTVLAVAAFLPAPSLSMPLVAAAVLCAVPGRRSAAAALVVGGMVSLAWISLEPYAQSLHLAPTLPAAWLDLFGDAGVAGDTVMWFGGDAPTVAGTTPNHLAVAPLLQLCLAGAALVMLDRRPSARRAALAVTGVAAFVAARWTWNAVSGAWEGAHRPWGGLGLEELAWWVVPAAWMGRWLRPRNPVEIAPSWTAGSLSTIGLAAAAGLALYAALWAHDPGARKPGRVMIDESRSRWSWTDAPFDRAHYGVQTVYNYVWLVRELELRYPQVERNTAPLTDERLAECDVLIVKVPTAAYSAEEVAAVVRFVEGGGGLWLIGEHTNIFGSTTYLNALAAPFGLRFRPDATTPWEGSAKQFTRMGAGHPHPSVRHVREFLWLTSCTIAASPLRSRTAFAGDRLFADRYDLDTNTFFGDFVLDGAEPFGRFLQAAAVEQGRGRVLAFTDSTTLSTYTMAMPGRVEWAVGSVEWLNRRGMGSVWRWACGGVFVALGLLALRKRAVPAALAGALLGAWCGSWICAGVDQAAYAWPPETRPARRVAWLYDREAAHLPAFDERAHDERAEWSAHTMFVTIQRAGLHPEVRRPDDGFEDAAAVVLFAGRETPPASRLHEYMQEGGHVLLVRSRADPDGRDLDGILEALGALHPGVPRVVARDSDGECSATLSDGSVVPLPPCRAGLSASEAWAADAAGVALVAVIPYGEGSLTVVASMELFSNLVMGSLMEPLTQSQFEVHQILYRLVDEIWAD